MKRMNEYQNTNSFSFTSCHIKRLAAIQAHYGSDLNSVAHSQVEHDYDHYTVRILTTEGQDVVLFDALVQVSWHGKVTEKERVEIQRKTA